MQSAAMNSLCRFHLSQTKTPTLAHVSLAFSGKGFEKTQLLSAASPLIGIELEDLTQAQNPKQRQSWQTQPSLLLQLLSNGDINLVNSNSRAKEPGSGAWTIHLLYPNPQNPHGPLKYVSTQNCSLVLPKSELSLVKKYHEPLKIWFSHPSIPQSDTPKIKLLAQNGPDCYTVTH